MSVVAGKKPEGAVNDFLCVFSHSGKKLIKVKPSNGMNETQTYQCIYSALYRCSYKAKVFMCGGQVFLFNPALISEEAARKLVKEHL